MRNVVRRSFMFTKFKLLTIFLSCVLNIILLCDTCIYLTRLSLKPSVSSRDKLNRLTTFSLALVNILKEVIAVCLKPPAMDANYRRQQKFVPLLNFFRFWCLFRQSLSCTIREKHRIQGGLKLLTFDGASVKGTHILRIEMNERSLVVSL